MPHKTITKTDYVRYLECPRYAWLYKNRPDLAEEDISVIARQGIETELLARGLFKPGVEVDRFYEEGSKLTRELMDKCEEVIYQAQPMTEKFLARADILIKKNDGWHLYEVKSSTQIRPEHIPDLRFQANVFMESGIKIQTFNIIHINNKYVFSEKKGLEINKLFVTENVTDIVTEGLRSEVNIMEKAHKTITSETEPKPDVFKRKFKYPMPKKMKEYYWKAIPEYSIYEISGITPNKLAALEARGILNIKDVPYDFPLGASKMAQVRLTKEKIIDVNKELLKKELGKIEFPIWFLDYETVQLAIPKFEGTRPWQQIAMQYSLHKLDEKGKLRHYYYLHTKKTFPYSKLLKHLKSDMGKTGTVISWNASFEKERNLNMAEVIPEYKDFLLGINSRTYDLMTIFKNIYKDYRFKGGTSLKKVLPVIVPELSYSALRIQGGSDATVALYDIILGNIKDVRRLKKHLLEYCKLDTLAMVRIYQILAKQV